MRYKAICIARVFKANIVNVHTSKGKQKSRALVFVNDGNDVDTIAQLLYEQGIKVGAVNSQSIAERGGDNTKKDRYYDSPTFPSEFVSLLTMVFQTDLSPLRRCKKGLSMLLYAQTC